MSKYVDYWRAQGIERATDDPVCWACGVSGEHQTIQRCHVVARSIGGTDTRDNIVPLCFLCHDHAPDTTDREAFIRWVNNWQGHEAYLWAIIRDLDPVKPHWEALFPGEPYDDETIRRFLADRAADRFTLWALGGNFAAIHGPQAVADCTATDLLCWRAWEAAGRPKEWAALPRPVALLTAEAKARRLKALDRKRVTLVDRCLYEEITRKVFDRELASIEREREWLETSPTIIDQAA